LRNDTCGILSGDDLEVDVTASEGADVQIGAPSSTKVYASTERSRSRLRIEARPGARVAWGPMPLILHEGADFAQETRIVLVGGSVVYSDVVVLGRLARGESRRFRRFESELRVVDGEPLSLGVGGDIRFEEHFVLEPEAMPGLGDSLTGMGAIASVYGLGMVETALDGFEYECGSVFAGCGALPNAAGCIARALAPSLSEALAFVEAAMSYLRATKRA
jgi:urease accessory protein